MAVNKLFFVMVKLVLCTIFAAIFGCMRETVQVDKIPDHFVTWSGIGPDKWASIWLIKRHINPAAHIQFVPITSAPQAGVIFDIPGANFYRNGNSTTFAQLVAHFQPKTQTTFAAFKAIVHDIEVTPWGNPQNNNSPIVETAFRGLQQHYGREQVPEACYLALFDTLFQRLTAQQAITSVEDLTPGPDCAKTSVIKPPIPAIPQMTIADLLQAMHKGRTVVFLDARESPEFAEGHIPGARNVKLQDVDAALAETVKNADIVVPYCIKDFRGYEVAKRLAGFGVSNTVIMQPFGIKGWASLNLPLEGAQKLTPDAAKTALNNCVNQPEICLHHEH